MIKFLRRDWKRYPKLGKKRKKKQVWRKPKGRDNKIREKRKGYPARVSIGYKKSEKQKNKGDKKKLILIKNIQELEKIKPEEVALIGRVGKKKKIEIIKKAKEKKIPVFKINIDKFLKKIGKKKEDKKIRKEISKTKENSASQKTDKKEIKNES
jgi:large subunit ribosomal protein L32e